MGARVYIVNQPATVADGRLNGVYAENDMWIHGNLAIGTEPEFLPCAHSIVIANGTPPVPPYYGSIAIYATGVPSSLALWTERPVVPDKNEKVSHSLKVTINGKLYKLLLSDEA